jgi:pimeloyl-ACP methyl ester carboxylesterase
MESSRSTGRAPKEATPARRQPVSKPVQPPPSPSENTSGRATTRGAGGGRPRPADRPRADQARLQLGPAARGQRGAALPRRGLRVYLLEWLDPGPAQDGLGLADYAKRLPMAALDAIAAETGEAAAVLAGHSLGGTFAAVLASLRPERARGLVLLDAPLAFGPGRGGPLARAVAAGRTRGRCAAWPAAARCPAPSPPC